MRSGDLVRGLEAMEHKKNTLPRVVPMDDGIVRRDGGLTSRWRATIVMVHKNEKISLKTLEHIVLYFGRT